MDRYCALLVREHFPRSPQFEVPTPARYSGTKSVGHSCSGLSSSDKVSRTHAMSHYPEIVHARTSRNYEQTAKTASHRLEVVRSEPNSSRG